MTAVRRTASLPCAAASAAQARRLLRELLSLSGDTGWLEAAELAVTEIVGNAVLHAHTDIELTATVGGGELRVEVRDHNPPLPMPRSYSEQATTGRGMALVA